MGNQATYYDREQPDPAEPPISVAVVGDRHETVYAEFQLCCNRKTQRAFLGANPRWAPKGNPWFRLAERLESAGHWACLSDMSLVHVQSSLDDAVEVHIERIFSLPENENPPGVYRALLDRPHELVSTCTEEDGEGRGEEGERGKGKEEEEEGDSGKRRKAELTHADDTGMVCFALGPQAFLDQGVLYRPFLEPETLRRWAGLDFHFKPRGVSAVYPESHPVVQAIHCLAPSLEVHPEQYSRVADSSAVRISCDLVETAGQIMRKAVFSRMRYTSFHRTRVRARVTDAAAQRLYALVERHGNSWYRPTVLVGIRMRYWELKHMVDGKGY